MVELENYKMKLIKAEAEFGELSKKYKKLFMSQPISKK
jgi:hypothetical protein